LRAGQCDLLLKNSLLLEEGWANWVQTYLVSAPLRLGTHPSYSRKDVFEVIQNLPNNLPNRQVIQEDLYLIYIVLFHEEEIIMVGGEKIPITLDLLHKVVLMLLDPVKGPLYDKLFEDKMGQKVRYIIGEQLLWQAEENLGPLCVPYAALIAANVTFDPAQMGLSDLGTLLNTDARLNPNARMAAISRLKPQKKDDVYGMAKLVAEKLSFSIPKELQG
jgi:hypothetical protein